MSRKESFFDEQFRSAAHDPTDQGLFERNLVFVIMQFKGQEMADVYSAIKDECTKLGLSSTRVDESGQNSSSAIFLMSAPMLTMNLVTRMASAMKERIYCS